MTVFSGPKERRDVDWRLFWARSPWNKIVDCEGLRLFLRISVDVRHHRRKQPESAIPPELALAPGVSKRNQLGVGGVEELIEGEPEFDTEECGVTVKSVFFSPAS